LFVQDPKDEHKLIREKRCFNFLESEEAAVVQYLIAGGHSEYTRDARRDPPSRVCSSFHAGPGQQVFGCGPTQRCDLLMVFLNDPLNLTEQKPVVLEYHNYHGSYRHYEGHIETCPFEGMPYRPTDASSLFDKFRRRLATAFSLVHPENVIFNYSVSTTCDYEHGAKSFPSLRSSPSSLSETHYSSIRELIASELSNEIWAKHPSRWIYKSRLLESIIDGSETGFVTLIGGEETTEMVRAHLPHGEPDAGENFGFCVQNFAPPLHLLSMHTRQQIIDYFGWGDACENGGTEQLKKFLKDLPSRTLNSSTFHSEETISTAYLQWLIKTRGFKNFTITHFLHYRFADYNKDYLEPLLQKRHEFKKEGNIVGAECAKLLGNGDFGYKGLEACNYDDTRLMTDVSFHANRKKTLLHVSLKHVSLIGVVRTKIKQRKRKSKFIKRKKSGARIPPDVGRLLFDEAVESGDEPNSSDDFEMEEEENDQFNNLILPIEDEIFLNNNADADDRGLSESEESSIANSESENYSSSSENSDSDELDFDQYDPTLQSRQQAETLSNDLDDMLVRSAEAEPSTSKQKRMIDGEHSYACSARTEPATNRKRKKKNAANRFLEKRSQKKGSHQKSRYKFNFLLSVVKSGERKQIKNFLPGAVSILSNSKKLFLGHIHVMLKCLDSGLAELAYIDTDSVLFSTTYPDLNDCIRPHLKEEWLASSVLADENSETSVHGKMKLEGTFRLGHFKTLKIYRLFNEDEVAGFSQAYTRCKGVNRRVALRLPDSAFDCEDLSRIVVHRTALRPTRTGEMTIAHEAKTLARPFNLKRYTTNDGIHTLPISFLSDQLDEAAQFAVAENIESDNDDNNDY
jgi:hypothetical protein